MDAQQLAKAKKLQKNVVLVEATHRERIRLRCDHKRALALAWKYSGYQPVLTFLVLNEKIQQTRNPWLLTKEGYSPSSFKADLWKKQHFILYQAWRNWRAAQHILHYLKVGKKRDLSSTRRSRGRKEKEVGDERENHTDAHRAAAAPAGDEQSGQRGNGAQK